MVEFLTAARSHLPITVVVDNNAGLGQILWEHMVLGHPEHGARWQRQADLAPSARSWRRPGGRVEGPADLEPPLAAAFAHDGPALVDGVVDPDEPRMPPKISYDQAKGFAEAFLRAQPRRAAIDPTLPRDTLAQMRS